MEKTINILNRKAKFDYEIIETYTAGIVLTGTEIKSIRLGKANIADSFCEFHNGNFLLSILKLMNICSVINLIIKPKANENCC
jgi:tmRNA-binding protein